jgi:hypothetical protein
MIGIEDGSNPHKMRGIAVLQPVIFIRDAELSLPGTGILLANPVT